MRYLYGDLTPASCQEDTLGLLQRVIDMAVGVLLKHQLVDEGQQAIATERRRLAEALDEIDGFQASLQQTIHSSFSDRPQGDVVADIGQAVSSTLQEQTKEGKTRLVAEAETHIQELQARVDGLERATFEALKGFFMDSPLPPGARALRCQFEDQRYLADAEILDAAGISCSYSLDTSASEFFSAPRRFSDLVPGKLELPVGTRKGWMKKEPVPEQVRLDDALVSRVVDIARGGEVRFTPRTGGEVDGVIVQFTKSPEPDLKVFKLVEAVQLQPVPAELLTAEHTEALQRFWNALLPRIEALYEARRDLTAVHLEGRDISQARLYAGLVSRLVTYLAPTIREIDQHSLVPGELSLTRELDEEGKREVFFLRKDKLLELIRELPAKQRRLFAPLGLESGPAEPAPGPQAPAQGQPQGRPPIREVPAAGAGIPGEAHGVVRGVLVQDEPEE